MASSEPESVSGSSGTSQAAAVMSLSCSPSPSSPAGVLGRCWRDAGLSCDSNLWASDHLVERVSYMREDWLSVKGRMSMCAAAVVGGDLALARLLCFARGVRKCNVVRDSPRNSPTCILDSIHTILPLPHILHI